MMAATGTRITAAPGRLTRPVGAVYRPPTSRCGSRSAATSVPHRSPGSDQADFPARSGPHQVVTAIPMATRPTVASSGNSLLTSHGLAAGTGRPSLAAALGLAGRPAMASRRAAPPGGPRAGRENGTVGPLSPPVHPAHQPPGQPPPRRRGPGTPGPPAAPV